MKVLGIETSCDETSVAIIDDKKNILSHITISQIDIHKEFGGVVPEIAARNHLDVLDKLIIKCLNKSKLTFKDIDAIAATSGPGLIGGVIVGMITAKTIASVYKKPFIAVNHLEGHALVPRLTNNTDFPFLLFLLSGGHCQILTVEKIGKYKKIGSTIDDALGEAFDKIAQLLGLDYPGGPVIEQHAKKGDANRFKFPKPLIDKNKQKQEKYNKFNFSFSGLKTAIRKEIEKTTKQTYIFGETHKKLTKQDIYDICASFQKTVADILINRFLNVTKLLDKQNFWKDKPKTLVISGGVAANQYIKNNLDNICKKHGYNLVFPLVKLCTDNGAMIAWVGIERMKLNLTNDLTFNPKARWALEELNSICQSS